MNRTKPKDMTLVKTPRVRAVVVSLLIYLSLLASQARADAYSCRNSEPEINLIQGSGSLSRVGTIDQGSSRSCFAVGMSEMIDAQRLRETSVSASQIAPMSVAILSPSEIPKIKSRLDGGNPLSAFNAIFANSDSLCDESYLSSLLGSFDDQQAYFGTLENMAEVIWQDEMALRHEALPASSSLGEATQTARVYFASAGLYRREPDGGLSRFAADWYEILAKFENQDIQTLRDFNRAFDSGLMRPLLQRLCEGHRVPKQTIPALTLMGMGRAGFDSHLPVRSEETMGKYAWSALRLPDPQPIGVGFCVNMLSSGNFFAPHPYDESCEQHFAVLAGTRCVDNRRQFLIRNSWGLSCGDRLALSLRDGCDHHGNVWVDGQNLMKSSFQLLRTCRSTDPGCQGVTK